MHWIYVGKTYTIERPVSRPVEVTAVFHWREPGKQVGKRVFHCLFTMGPRQASRRGMATAPKFHVGDVYPIRRGDDELVFMKLYRQGNGAYGDRYLFMKKVKRPANWRP